MNGTFGRVIRTKVLLGWRLPTVAVTLRAADGGRYDRTDHR
jgi:hypothetical protein